jgi:hypothetical protein
LFTFFTCDRDQRARSLPGCHVDVVAAATPHCFFAFPETQNPPGGGFRGHAKAFNPPSGIE